jgi:hypothetical protein
MRPKEAQSSKRTAVVNDIESALEQFAEDLEEGNKELMISISGLKRELEAEINKLNGRLSVLENSNQISNIGVIELPKTKYMIQEKEVKTEEIVAPALDIHTIDPQPQPQPQPQPLENDIKNRYGSIFELYDQGKSIEYIAKKTGMNKGEIQLIIQLARQEEQFRV